MFANAICIEIRVFNGVFGFACKFRLVCDVFVNGVCIEIRICDSVVTTKRTMVIKYSTLLLLSSYFDILYI